ncbi:MAG TPA: nuclear transport factor 2 family protein [Edaphobacter sp.]
MLIAAIVWIVLASALANPYAFAGQHEKKHDEKREVEALEEKWRQAQLAADITTMDKMLAEDFIGISMSGQVNTKPQQLERVRSRKLVVTKIELSDMKVKLVGPVAIVTSLADVEGTNEGVSVKGKYRYTRVYRRLPSGGWHITSFEATRIAPPHAERGTATPPQPPSGDAAIHEPRFW